MGALRVPADGPAGQFFAIDRQQLAVAPHRLRARGDDFAVDVLRNEVVVVSGFKGAEIVWCQEEPKNQGAWSFLEPNLEWVLGRIGAVHGRAVYAGRAASAAPATGLASRHKAEQAALVNDALTFGGRNGGGRDDGGKDGG